MLLRREARLFKAGITRGYRHLLGENKRFPRSFLRTLRRGREQAFTICVSMRSRQPLNKFGPYGPYGPEGAGITAARRSCGINKRNPAVLPGGPVLVSVFLNLVIFQSSNSRLFNR